MTIESQFDPVRMFTNLDPYNWQVDNRPLEDINSNQSILARFADAVSDATKMSAMAAGFIARGFAQDDMFVGSLSYPGGLSLSIDHGFLVQSLQASAVPPIDLKKYPHLGLQQQPKLLVGGIDLQAPSTPGNRNLYTIQARKVAANATISHYDATNPHEAGTTVIGTVQYAYLVDEMTSLETEDIYPSPTAGWVSILRVKIENGDTELSAGNITFDRFLLDGGLKDTSQYDVYTITKPDVTISNDINTQISGIGVDVRDALVFLQGVYQNPSNYDIITESEIVWHGTIPDDSKLDFVVIKSGAAPGGGGGGTYSYETESFIAGGSFAFTANGSVVRVEPFAHVGAVSGATIEVTASSGTVIPPGTYTVLPSSTTSYIEFTAAVSGSGTVDFYVTGYPVGQQLFGPTSNVDVSYSFVFANGVYQPDSTFNAIGQTVYLPEPVPPGAIVDLAVTIGGISTGGIPSGGLPGQLLKTVNTGLEWSYPTRTLTVTSITSNSSVSTVIVCSSDFDETTELYDGMLMRLSGFRTLGNFIGNKSSTTVTIQIGALIIPVKRPREGNLLVDDLYDGALLSFNNTEGVLEIVSPATTARVLGTSSGNISADEVDVVPLQPIYTLFSGLQLTFPVPGAAPADKNVGTSVVLNLTTEGLGGPVVAKSIVRNGGADLRAGDMVRGHIATVQYDAYLNVWILLNPAIQSVSNSFEFSGMRRQTVLVGPRFPLHNWRQQDFGNATGAADGSSISTPTSSIVDSYKPHLIQLCDSLGVPGDDAAATQFFCINSSPIAISSQPTYVLHNSGPAYASFSAGYGPNGAIEYVEQLPNSAAFSKAALTTSSFSGNCGKQGAEISSMQRTSTSLIINFRNTDPAHGFQVGDWVNVSNSTNQWTNGCYYIRATSTYSITIGIPNGPGAPWPSSSTNTAWKVSGMLFMYADRNPTSGAITYGYTRKRPIYVSFDVSRPFSQTTSTGLEGIKRELGQHVFNIDTMKMTIGDGSSYSDVQRVFIGEVTLGTTGATMQANQLCTYAYNGQEKIMFWTASLPASGYTGRVQVGIGVPQYSITQYFTRERPDQVISGISDAESYYFQQTGFHFLPTNAATGPGEINHGVTILNKDASDLRIKRWGNGAINVIDRDGEVQSLTLNTSGLIWNLDLKRDF